MNTSNTKDIIDGANLIAQIYDINLINETVFPTPGSNEMQFGVGLNKEKKTLKTHIHKRVKRQLKHTSEFLYVIQGYMKIDIYNEKEEIVKKIKLKPGMALLQFFGGHSIELGADTKYFEIKQGPYLGQNDDKYFIEE